MFKNPTLNSINYYNPLLFFFKRNKRHKKQQQTNLSQSTCMLWSVFICLIIVIMQQIILHLISGCVNKLLSLRGVFLSRQHVMSLFITKMFLLCHIEYKTKRVFQTIKLQFCTYKLTLRDFVELHCDFSIVSSVYCLLNLMTFHSSDL